MEEEKTGRRALSALMTVVMVISLAAGVPAGHISRVQAEGVQGPRQDSNGNVTWDRVYFGGYPQTDATGENSDAILWRVLAVNGDDALLQADCNLDTFYYHNTADDFTWANSSMRSWLNGYTHEYNQEGKNFYYDRSGFIYRAFTESERDAILTAHIETKGNTFSQTSDEEAVWDKVFLLSYEEAVNPDYGFSTSYDASNPARVRKNSAYVAAGGSLQVTSSEVGAAGAGGKWWLRTAGQTSASRAFVLENGQMNLKDGRVGYSQAVCVCPAIHLDLTKKSLWSYAGTISSNGVSTTGAQPPTDEQRHAGEDKSKIVTKIEAHKTKVYYKTTDTWSTSDIEVEVTYANNNTDIIKGDLCSITTPDLSTPGVKTVTVTYQDKTSVIQVTVYNEMVITTQPVSRTAKVGDQVTFSVAASGGSSSEYTYQWEYSVNGAVWNLLDGKTEASYTTSALRTSDSGKKYRCKVTSGGDSVFSEAAALTVGTETVTHTGHDTVVPYNGSMIDVSQYFDLDSRVSNPVYALLGGQGNLTGTMLYVYIPGDFLVKVTTYAQNGYEEASATATLSVREGGIVCNASDYTGQYDGKEHGITVTVSQPEGAKVTYSTNGTTYSGTEPKYSACGEYTVYYKVEKENYDAVTGSARVKITQQTAEIKAKDQQIQAGDTISQTSYTASLQKGDKVSQVTLKADPESTDKMCEAGTITPDGAKIVNASGQDVTASYQLTYTPGVLQILHNSNLAPDGIRVEKEKTEYGNGETVLLDDLKATVYYSDGYEQEVEDYTTNLEKLKLDTAGTQELEVTWTGNGKTVTGKVELTVTSASPKHQGINADISCQNGEKVDVSAYFVLDSLAGEASYSVTDPSGKKQKLTGTELQVESAGTYTVEVTTAANASCTEGSATAVLTVSLSEVSFTAAGYAGKYDGLAHGIRVTLASADGYEIFYSKDGETFEKQLPEYSKAGSYQTWYQIRQGESVKASGSCTVQIDRCPLTIQAKDQVVFWGVEPEKEYVAEGLISGDVISEITIVPGAKELTEKGSIVFSAAVINRGDTDVTDCYEITYQKGLLKIRHDDTLAPERMQVEKKVTAYSVGQKLALDDISVVFHYADGYEEDGSGQVTVSSENVDMSKAGTYSIVVTGKTDTSLVSEIEITVSSGPVIGEQPSDLTVKVGETAVFSVKAEGSGDITYQWLSSSNGKTWKELSGETDAELEVTASADKNGTQYQCRLTDTDGSVTSRAAVLTVGKIQVVNQVKQEELSLYYDAVAQKEMDVSQYFTLGVGAGTPAYSYRLEGEEKYHDIIGGKMLIAQTGVYEIFMGTAANGDYAAAEPISVKLTVKEGILKYEAKSVLVAYDGQPHSPEIAVQTAGAVAAYYGSDVDEEPEENAYQSTMPEFTEAGTHYVYFKISKDNYKEIQDSVAVVIYREDEPQIPVIEKQPEDTTILAGSPAVLSIKAISPLDLSYQWMMDRGDGKGWSLIEGAVSDTYTTASMESSEDGIRYRCEVSNSDGSTLSNAVQVTVKLFPVNNAGSTVSVDFARVKDAPLDIRPYFTLDENAGTPVYRLVSGSNAILNGTQLTVRSVGTYKIGMQTAENGRYEAGREVYATLKIAEGVIENLVGDVKVTYDGKPHSLDLLYDGSQDAQIMYYSAKETEEEEDEDTAPIRFSEVVPELTDAGTYLVYYRILRPNYKTAEGTGKVIIDKRPITIAADDQTIYAGGKPDETAFSLKRSSLAENDQVKELKFAAAPSDLSTVGSGKLFISGARIYSGDREVTDNYSITYVPGNYTVVHNGSLFPDRITAALTNAIYKVGEKPDLTGLKVLAVYEDGHSIEVSDYTTNVDELNLGTPGLYRLEVAWTENGRQYHTEVMFEIRDDSGSATQQGEASETTDPGTEAVSFEQDGFRYTVLESDDGVNKVSVGAAGDTGVETAKLPETVTYNGVEYRVAKLSANAFDGHQELTALELPSSMETIGDNSLRGTGVSVVNIPASVKQIGENAFAGCEQLTALTFEGTEAPVLSKEALGGVSENVVITVPAGSTGYLEQEAFTGRTPVEAQTDGQQTGEQIDGQIGGQTGQQEGGAAEVQTLTAGQLAANREKLNLGTVIKWKGSSIKVSWGKVSGADGYEICAAPAGAKYKQADQTAGGNAKSVKLKKAAGTKLSAAKIYHVRIRAYRMAGGQKQYIATGKDYYVAGAKHKKFTNVKAIRLKKTQVTISKGKAAQIRATAVKEKKKRKLLPAKYGKTISYSSSSPSVAVVSAKGKVTAKKKGSCVIYVTANNGVSKKVKVKVK